MKEYPFVVASAVVSEKSQEKLDERPIKEDFYIGFIEKFVKPVLEAGKNLGDTFTPVVCHFVFVFRIG